MKDKKIVKGMGFCGWLTIAFIVLKLCGVITWRWLWVLAPLWINWGVGLFFLGLTVLVAWIRSRG